MHRTDQSHEQGDVRETSLWQFVWEELGTVWKRHPTSNHRSSPLLCSWPPYLWAGLHQMGRCDWSRLTNHIVNMFIVHEHQRLAPRRGSRRCFHSGAVSAPLLHNVSRCCKNTIKHGHHLSDESDTPHVLVFPLNKNVIMIRLHYASLDIFQSLKLMVFQLERPFSNNNFAPANELNSLKKWKDHQPERQAPLYHITHTHTHVHRFSKNMEGLGSEWWW